MCALNARHPWEAVMMRESQDTEAWVLQSWGAETRLPPFYGGQGGPGEFDEWVEEGRKGVPSSAKPICAKAQRQVSRHVRGQRGERERERGEEGTGGEPGPHGLGSAC